MKAVLFFVPESNPYSEPLYPKVRKWLLEIDDDGYPVREVGLDSEGIPLFRAPYARDYGFWTDSNVVFSKADLDHVTAREFEDAWTKAE